MATRPGDLAGRWGGEEFLLLLPGTEIKGAQALAERLRVAVSGLGGGPAGVDGPEIRVTLGVACWDGRESAEALVARADRALYAGKQSGRDRVVASGD